MIAIALRAAVCLLFAGLMAYAGGLVDGAGDRKPHLSGGSEGGGNLPFVGPVGGPHGSIVLLETPTPGIVVDAQRQPVAGTLVLVTHPSLGVVDIAVTDGDGLFIVGLPTLPGLELALPDENVAGIGVVAGQPVLIVVP